MNKKIRRILSIVIAFILLISSGSVTVLASENDLGLSQEQLYVHLYEAIYLETNRPESDFYKLDTSQLNFGNTLNTYYYDNNSVITTEAIYIPVFYENELFFIAHMIYSDNILVGVELSKDLVEPLNEYVNCNIGVVFDSNNTYVSDGKELVLIQSNSVVSENTYTNYRTTDISNMGIEVINNTKINTDIDEEMLSKYCSFTDLSNQYEEIILNRQYEKSRATNAFPSSYKLNFTIVQQNGQPICWAAAVAGIGRQKTGIVKTAEQVSRTMYGDLRGGNTYMALCALQQIFKLRGNDLYYAPYFSQIKASLYEEQSSIYARVYGNSGAGINHALSIYGYTDFEVNTYDGLLMVGDSNYTSGRTIYFVNDRNYPYTLNGVTGYIDEFILLY